MNKDVIYIEPDDDITDIISKIESAKEKIVALVPPKKSGVLRSVVNIKLITKACAAEKKNVVLVTTDPSILKLAASVKIPVTKNLQTAPAIPTEADVEETATEEVVEDDIKVNDGTAVEEEDENDDEPEDEDEEEEEEKEEEKSDEKAEDEEKTEETEEEKAEKAEKKKTDSAVKELAAEAKAEEKAKKKAEKEAAKKDKKKSDNPVIAWLSTYKKWVIGGSIALVLAILFLIWALVIAPAVKISVVVRTDSNNFSELVSFTSDPASENAAEGIFYLEEVKLEEEQKTEFTATGTKNIGDKASGEIIVQASFRKGETLSINAGSVFKAGGLTFYSDSDINLAWSGNDFSECDNKNPSQIMAYGCIRSARVSVTAAAPGEAYNIDKTSFVAPNDRITAYSEAAFTGGTDKTVTIVSKENVDSAKAKIINNNKENEQAIKDALYAKIGEGKIPIESSFRQNVSDPVSTPNIDEEVKDTTIPSIVVTTTTAIYVLDQTKLEEFISAKAKLAEDQKIYAINNPFVESFVATESGYTGKLKTTYYTGPKITENDIIELVKGKGVGDIRHDLGSVNGVSKISIDPSFPWVTSAPNDSNKITVELTIEDKNNSEE